MSDAYPPPEEPSGPYPPYQQPYQPGFQQPFPPPYGAPAPYGYAMVPGYGVDPVTGQPMSDKSKLAAGLLNLLLPFVGVCGVGRLYQGQIGIGLTQLLGSLISWVLLCAIIGFVTLPAFCLWSIIDGIVLLTGRPTDQHGRLLR
ncbi:TM2 domain-containing protein [Nocardioides sp. WS12]|uniref:TM2 domain-containing protein n=1 Tax=Nocardioides sp. WS12 TaxID=2486272 RepID=UPI0015FA266C|nr:TM2 domain-containing protein [Nocardioides sp. WS12]